MEKRLNRIDIVFSLAFLLMLIIAVGAFFYGVKIGSERTEAKYEEKEEPASMVAATPFAYQQQDLVSFYHTVFLPYREFQNEWLDAQNAWLADPSTDRSVSMKQLAKSAGRKYEEIKKANVPTNSPLLAESQNSYLKSLKLFSDAFSGLAAAGNENTAAAAVNKVNSDSFYKEGKIQALTGQNDFYESMLKWAATVNMEIPGEYDTPDVLSLPKWKALPLVVKLKVTSDYLADELLLTDFTPQDLTARIDQFIGSGQADKRKLKSFGSIAELLTSTEGVRDGDFLQMKARFYENEQLPQLPFFFIDK